MLFLPRLPLILCVVLLLLGSPLMRAARAQAPIALGVYYWDNGLCAPGDAGAVSAWRAKTGRLPAVWAIYQSWSGWNQFPAAEARRARAMGASLLVTWEPWSGDGDDVNWSCAAVAAGTYDPYIRAYARAMRDGGVPVMVRLAQEMNGDWYPWGTAFEGARARHNGNAPADFVAMWRHVVQIFRVEGARNASFVWSPNVFYVNQYNWSERQSSDLVALYPGDSWVDWIGLSVYNDGVHQPWRSFAQLFDGAYRTVTALTAKPLMVAELGVTEEGAPAGTSKAQWIEQTYLSEIPRYYGRVRMVNYFFRDKTAQGEANFRFDSSPAALNAFRTVATSPLYGGNLGDSSRSVVWNPSQPGDRPQISVVSPARLQPRELPSVALTGNNGILRNGSNVALAPRLNVER